MITGIQSVATIELKAATTAATSAGGYNAKRAKIDKADLLEIALLKRHLKQFHQTPEERARALKTIAFIEKGGRRYGLEQGYESQAQEENFNDWPIA